MEALPAAVYMTDAHGRITFYNEAAARLWGYRPELGKGRFCGSYKLYRPDGTHLPHEASPLAVALNSKRAIRGVEAVAERPDGTRVACICHAAPVFDAAGKLTGAVNMLVDLGRRKVSERLSAGREAQLAVFVEHAPTAIAMFDRQMRYLAVSRRFVVSHRLAAGAQLIGRSQFDIFPDVSPRWREIYARVLAGEELLSHQEEPFLHPDGGTDWVRWSMAPWRESNGDIGGALLFAEVRTEQVEARRALAESEARFRATFENAAVGVVLVDPNGSLLRVNDSFARMLGYSCEELKTKTFQDITHPDDLATNLTVLKKTLSGEASSYCIDKRYARKDGGFVWANLTVGCVRKPDGTVDYFLSVVQDITERKRAEARLAERNAQLELAHKAARVGSYTFDLPTKAMRIARASAAVYGLSHSTMEIGAEQWFARVHRDDVQRLREEHISAFKERRHELINEFRFVRPGGEVRWLEARSLIDYDRSGRAKRMTGVYIDVTERRKAEDHKSLLVAELDHRVKNILACVAAVAQHSRDRSTSTEGFLEVLNGRINALANTHALLSRSHWEGVGLAELVRSELAFCTKEESTLIEGPKVELAAEATQPVAMVLHELATNAAKYGALSNGHGRVSVRWRLPSRGRARGRLVLEWRETGGPSIIAPGASGYGTSVIRDLIPYELGGEVDYQLAGDGARCRLEIPTKWLIP
ncbi:MAG TPA: PAS domain S-box protein [Hyphomicrobiaceae bacterium]|jgi:PAS domain S-box-containing protein|nr:PAS domain S-box protein [Hyphomicrobiaceae bacterium]